MIEQFNTFFAGDAMYNTYLIMLVIGATIFIISTVLAFLGGDADGAIDTDSDGIEDIHADTGFSDFKIFSLKTITAFVMFVGLGGLIFGQSTLGFIGALGLGILMMVATAYVLMLVLKLQESGNIDDAAFIGQTGTVYMQIPGGHDVQGKVQVALKKGVREIFAIADAPIPTGATVKVIALHSQGCYHIEKVD